MRAEMLTIGHSTHESRPFVKLLAANEVGTLADVRRYPGSRRNPQFDAAALARLLAAAGIGYEPFGEQLGGRRRPRPGSPNDGWRVAAFRAYADYMREPAFAAALERLQALARAGRAAIMCAEGDWHRCHRRLIADALAVRGWRVVHIGPDGSAEEHQLTQFAVPSGGTITYPPAQGSLTG